MEFREFLEKQECNESLKGVVKSGWNAIKGVAKAGSGLMTIGDEAIAKAVGQGTKGRMTRGLSQFKTGVRQLLVDDKPKIKSEPTKSKPDPEPTKSKPDLTKPKPEKSQKTKPIEPKSKKEIEWERLTDLHRRAKTSTEKKDIQRRMASADPDRYIRIMTILRKRGRRKS
jgi:hypothetical protein